MESRNHHDDPGVDVWIHFCSVEQPATRYHFESRYAHAESLFSSAGILMDGLHGVFLGFDSWQFVAKPAVWSASATWPQPQSMVVAWDMDFYFTDGRHGHGQAAHELFALEEWAFGSYSFDS